MRQNASDLLIVAGYGVSLRVNGSLAPPAGPPLSGEEVRGLVLPLLDARQYEELQRNKSVDFCFVREPIGRFRANIHYQRGTLAASIRLLPAKIPTLESLHLPPALARLAERRNGLVLVTGPTGCGKTSTLAALIDLINTRRRDHIVTIEDPIEYQHPSRSSVVEQIEVGHDTPEFVRSLRGILRQSPDVILVGEMRDGDTMATVLTAAETGHLVFSTLHTNDAVQAVNRILDSFAAAQQPQIRQQLSLALRGGGGAATDSRRGRNQPLSGARDHDGHRRRAQPDPPRRRPSAPLADFHRPGRRHDDDGAEPGGAGAGRQNLTGDGHGALLSRGGPAAVSLISVWRRRGCLTESSKLCRDARRCAALYPAPSFH